jgi:hypothetical protein
VTFILEEQGAELIDGLTSTLARLWASALGIPADEPAVMGLRVLPAGEDVAAGDRPREPLPAWHAARDSEVSLDPPILGGVSASGAEPGAIDGAP